MDLANSIIVPGAITNKDYWENGVSKDGTVILTFPLSKYTKSLGVATTAATNLPLVTLKATMVYMDMAGAELQNNLNLRVTCDSKMRYGNAGERQGADAYDMHNTVEQVVWKDLSPNTSVALEVIQYGNMHPNAGTVPFAVVWSVTK